MSRDIDRSKTLGAATEHELLIALGDHWLQSELKAMTRDSWTETHHQLLYAIGHLTDLKVHLEARREETDFRYVVLEAEEIRVMLAATIKYVLAGRGGTSALGDRNTR
jgi:hypothetical protein